MASYLLLARNQRLNIFSSGRVEFGFHTFSTAMASSILTADSGDACVSWRRVLQLEKQVALLDVSSVDAMRQRLTLLKAEWDDFKKERTKHVRACVRSVCVWLCVMCVGVRAAAPVCASAPRVRIPPWPA